MTSATTMAHRARLQEQQRWIAAARELHGPTPVRLHHVPREYRGLGRRIGIVYWTERGMRVTSTHAQWLDHWGSTKLSDGRIAFVSEPYGVNSGSLAEIERLADELGLDHWVSPNSWWYPGHTIRIVFATRRES